jgi:putative transposase
MAGTYTNLLFHIVFSTKRRTGLITPELEPDLYAYIGGVIRNQGGKLLDAGGMSDHVHLLLKSKPNVALSDLVRDIKANSSKWINESKWKIRKFGWQDGFASRDSLEVHPKPKDPSQAAGFQSRAAVSPEEEPLRI